MAGYENETSASDNNARQAAKRDYTENIKLAPERTEARRSTAAPPDSDKSDAPPEQTDLFEQLAMQQERDITESNKEYNRDKQLLKLGIITEAQFKYKWRNR